MRQRTTRRARYAVAAVVVIALGLLRLTPLWELATARAFDLLSTIDAPAPENSDVVLVAIDEPSFAEIGLQWPWPRDLHAQLIQSLRAAGARSIAFDLVFAEQSDPAADAALAGAMGPDVVLAADETISETPQGTLLTRTEPLPELKAAGARFGIASLSQDRDGVVRRLPRYPDGLMRVLAGSPAPVPEGALIQYFGPAGSYPRVSYYQALDPDTFLPPDALRGKTVIVGYAVQAAPETGAGGATDSFETPWTLRTGALTAGVEVQATIHDNLRHGLWIAAAPGWVGFITLALGALAGLAASAPRSPARKTALLLAGIALSVGLAWLAVRFGRLWVSPVDPAAAIAFVTVGIGTLDLALEQKARRAVESAFGQYLNAEMVARLAEDPSLLKLGGEARDMTVLFSDIRGFTSISEAMKDDPQGLTALINEVLTPLTDVILAHGGTIDKYMGDCVMAFWNAPLDQPDHAHRAVAAGEAMVAAMPGINAAIAHRLPTGAGIAVGVGINSGVCVVGNMGSARRFDYSVLGDAVNVASRLEGLTKTYGVAILLGEETARRLGEAPALRLVDQVAVRGKSDRTGIYALSEARDA
jgi:adenylate cyclase